MGLKIIFVISMVLVFLLNYLKPRIDETPDGKLILWYGSKSKRKYIIL